MGGTHTTPAVDDAARAVTREPTAAPVASREAMHAFISARPGGRAVVVSPLSCQETAC